MIDISFVAQLVVLLIASIYLSIANELKKLRETVVTLQVQVTELSTNLRNHLDVNHDRN